MLRNDELNLFSRLLDLDCWLSCPPTPMDFLGNTEQALKNCEIVWGKPHRISHEDQGGRAPCGHCYKCHRHAYLDSGKEFFEYLEDTMRGEK